MDHATYVRLENAKHAKILKHVPNASLAIIFKIINVLSFRFITPIAKYMKRINALSVIVDMF